FLTLSAMSIYLPHYFPSHVSRRRFRAKTAQCVRKIMRAARAAGPDCHAHGFALFLSLQWTSCTQAGRVDTIIPAKGRARRGEHSNPLNKALINPPARPSRAG